MPTPPPRKRFQIHLSTAIVMMFVAGGLVWANVWRRLVILDFDFSVPSAGESLYGWPSDAVWMDSTLNGSYPLGTSYLWRWFYIGAIIDICVLLSTLFATWFLYEWLIRHRAAGKGA